MISALALGKQSQWLERVEVDSIPSVSSPRLSLGDVMVELTSLASFS